MHADPYIHVDTWCQLVREQVSIRRAPEMTPRDLAAIANRSAPVIYLLVSTMNYFFFVLP